MRTWYDPLAHGRPRVAALVAAASLALAACAPCVAPPDAATPTASSGAAAAKANDPLAKIGDALASLHAEYAAFRASQADHGAAFAPNDSTLRVDDGRVTIDALASGDAERLERDLVELGLRDASRFAFVVSGSLPIHALPDAAALESLRSMRPARMETR